ncbi:hypothetical protein Tamer19_16540 [Cupriavidus sp. TA19]|uniref:hypothetical protein n=1 Tax=unclassified Cupriavidus TaxID=2640874 RepID=UPI0027294887|nr:hypothetical protein [Cupriavidus sp. TA19]GLC92246.1 hypothetical protein Tamer19_16540 [Cupriavidus sp. TA19]
MSYGQPTYVGGLGHAAALDPSRLDALESENEALRRELSDLWQQVSQLHEREAPGPGPMQAVNAMRAAVADLTKRLDKLEADTPKSLKAASDAATTVAVDAVARAYGPLLADMRDELDKLLQTADEIGKTLDGLGRSLDDTIRSTAKQHDSMAALASWQIDVAAKHLVEEARRHVGE